MSILLLWQIPTSGFYYFWWRGSINKISPIGEKKIHDHPKKNSGKLQLFDKTVSLLSPNSVSEDLRELNLVKRKNVSTSISIYLNFSMTCRQNTCTPRKFFAHLTADTMRASTTMLDVPFRKYCSGQKTLSHLGPRTRNTLPAQIKLRKSIKRFKHDINASCTKVFGTHTFYKGGG